MATITIYGSPASTYVRSARMTAEEKGVDYDLVPVGPDAPEIADLHPFKKIPAVRHGEVAIYETSAIMRYLDAAFDGPGLVPGDIAAATRMEQWISAINAYLYDTMVRRYVLQYVFPRGANGQPDRGVIDAALPEIKRQLGLIDAALERHDFLAGPALSLADLLLAPIMTYLGRMPESDELFSDCANIARAGDAMTSRPSYQNTLPPAA